MSAKLWPSTPGAPPGLLRPRRTKAQLTNQGDVVGTIRYLARTIRRPRRTGSQASSIALVCNAVCNFPTVALEVVGSRQSPCCRSPSDADLEPRPGFPPPALPGFAGTTGRFSATWAARPVPRRASGSSGRANRPRPRRTQIGFPVLRSRPSPVCPTGHAVPSIPRWPRWALIARGMDYSSLPCTQRLPGPSPYTRKVGDLHIGLFEACS